MNAIDLPRQVRDKHTENSKRLPFSQVSVANIDVDVLLSVAKQHCGMAFVGAADGAETSMVGPFCTKHRIFAKTGSGQT
eukprot:COSAG06_NODE_1932_length_8039_cov_5.660327_3_plen_79_part_00